MQSLILVWNGYSAGGKGGTADVASHTRLLRRLFIHIHTRLHTTKQYSKLLADLRKIHEATPRKMRSCRLRRFRYP